MLALAHAIRRVISFSVWAGAQFFFNFIEKLFWNFFGATLFDLPAQIILVNNGNQIVSLVSDLSFQTTSFNVSYQDEFEHVDRMLERSRNAQGQQVQTDPLPPTVIL